MGYQFFSSAPLSFGCAILHASRNGIGLFDVRCCRFGFCEGTYHSCFDLRISVVSASFHDIQAFGMNVLPSRPSITQIYRIELPSSGPTTQIDFQPLRTLISPVPQIARSIEPAMHRLVLSSANTLEVVDINNLDSSPPNLTGEATNVTQTIPSSRADSMDELVRL